MTARDLHADSLAELAKDNQYIFNLVEFHFDSGALRYTTAHSDVTWNAQTYVSSPNLVEVGAVSETSTMEIGSMKFTLSGVNQANIALVLSENLTDRKVLLYRGMRDAGNYTVIADPILIYSGRIKSFSVSEEPGNTASVDIETASAFADFTRTAGRRSNHQDQEVYLRMIGIDPDVDPDMGFEFAHQLNQDIKWGRP